MDRDRLPVIVGAGQVTLRDQQWPDIAGPLDLAAEAVRAAIADSGAHLLDDVDHLSVAPVMSWDYANAPQFLAEVLGLAPGERRYLDVGGNTPQQAVADLAQRLQHGEIEAAIVCGAECSAGKRNAKRSGHLVDWGRSPVPLGRPHVDGTDMPTEAELRHSVVRPMEIYPLWEPALRTAAGRTPEEHDAAIAKMLAGMTEVAAANPYAWKREVRGAADLMTPGPQNRMTALPYTLACNSYMRVDMGAAVVLTTAERAAQRGVPPDRLVYVWSAADAVDVHAVTERVAYDHSPAMRVCAERCLGLAGIGADDIALFDLYSCFPSAVQLAAEALGIGIDDTRGMTVTGGMAAFGGPWNDYVTHSIATMATELRARPGAVGVVTGNGGYVGKHSWGVYSSQPPVRAFARNDAVADQAALDAEAHPRMDLDTTGEAVVDGYTVTFGRDGELEQAIALARFGTERRTLAATREPGVCDALRSGEWFGATVTVGAGGRLEL